MGRKLKSAGTTIVVTGSEIDSALRRAIQGLAPLSFVKFDQPSLFARVRHPKVPPYSTTDFRDATPTEDGANYDGHTMIDWGGKFAYDPIARKAMFAANGANSAGANVPMYSWMFNAFSVYDEATDTWTAERGIRAEAEQREGGTFTVDLGANALSFSPDLYQATGYPAMVDARFTSTGALPAPLQPNVDYTLRRPANSAPGTPWEVWQVAARVTLANAGSGTHTFWDQPDCIVHFLGNQAIDVKNRRFFKKKFREASILVRDLGKGTWSVIQSPPDTGDGEPYYGRSAGMDYVPPLDKLWLWCLNRSNGFHHIVEQSPMGADVSWTVKVPASSFGSAAASNGAPCVFNPRAFGGDGGVLVGGQGTQTWKINVKTLEVFSAGQSAEPQNAPYGGRVCRDPIGDGWYHAANATGKLHRTSGDANPSQWSEVAPMPNVLATPNAARDVVLCPIDAEGTSYGAIWFLASGLTGPEFASQGGLGGFLFKPKP